MPLLRFARAGGRLGGAPALLLPALLLPAGLLLLAAAGGCREVASPEVAVRVVDRVVVDLAELGTIERVVALETSDAALLGGVDRVILDPATGDLLVGDLRSSQQVYRFSPEGRLLATYEDGHVRQSPHLLLSGFTPLADGRVVLLAAGRALVYDPDGTLVQTLALPYAPGEAAILGDRLFLRGHSTGEPLEHTVFVYDAELRPAGSFHPYDTRRDLLPFLPLASLAAGDGRVVVSDLFSFRLTAYGADGQPAATWVFPGAETPPVLPEGRGRVDLTEEERQALRDSLHRARYVGAFDGGLFVIETHLGEGVIDPGVFDPDTGVLLRFPGLRPVASQLPPGALAFDELAGTWPGGLIGVVDTPETAERLAAADPRFAGLTHRREDNPLIVLFRFDPAALAVPGAAEAPGAAESAGDTP